MRFGVSSVLATTVNLKSLVHHCISLHSFNTVSDSLAKLSQASWIMSRRSSASLLAPNRSVDLEQLDLELEGPTSAIRQHWITQTISKPMAYAFGARRISQGQRQHLISSREGPTDDRRETPRAYMKSNS